jgi:hypothetical protein
VGCLSRHSGSSSVLLIGTKAPCLDTARYQNKPMCVSRESDWLGLETSVTRNLIPEFPVYLQSHRGPWCLTLYSLRLLAYRSRTTCKSGSGTGRSSIHRSILSLGHSFNSSLLINPFHLKASGSWPLPTSVPVDHVIRLIDFLNFFFFFVFGFTT